ncbi:MAG: hypothetical protein H6822_07840 [Planctomycetaceae bacterium]|nr:hypothetical protein [Planctomycetales bacterium]MCB9922077.1 hypothetical protein [Planctomycetaceae bacterium]
MKHVIAVAVVMVGTIFSAPCDVDAAPRGRFRLFVQSYSSNGAVAFGAPTFPNSYGTPHRFPTAEELYPKYYGSFHYRHLDNIGIPSGDIGLRGNGLYMSPW